MVGRWVLFQMNWNNIHHPHIVQQMWQQKTACVGIVCVFVYCFHFTAIIDAKVMRWIEKLSNCPLMRAKWKFDFWLVKWYAPSVQCLYLNNRRMICGTWACRMQRPCIIIMICLRPFESTLYSNLLSIYFGIILCVPFVKVTLCVCIPLQCIKNHICQNWNGKCAWINSKKRNYF